MQYPLLKRSTTAPWAFPGLLVALGFKCTNSLRRSFSCCALCNGSLPSQRTLPPNTIEAALYLESARALFFSNIDTRDAVFTSSVGRGLHPVSWSRSKWITSSLMKHSIDIAARTILSITPSAEAALGKEILCSIDLTALLAAVIHILREQWAQPICIFLSESVMWLCIHCHMKKT